MDVVQMPHHSNTTTSVLLTPRDPQGFGLILNKAPLDLQDFQDPSTHHALCRFQVLLCSVLLALQRSSSQVLHITWCLDKRLHLNNLSILSSSSIFSIRNFSNLLLLSSQMRLFRIQRAHMMKMMILKEVVAKKRLQNRLQLMMLLLFLKPSQLQADLHKDLLVVLPRARATDQGSFLEQQEQDLYTSCSLQITLRPLRQVRSPHWVSPNHVCALHPVTPTILLTAHQRDHRRHQ